MKDVVIVSLLDLAKASAVASAFIVIALLSFFRYAVPDAARRY